MVFVDASAWIALYHKFSDFLLTAYDKSTFINFKSCCRQSNLLRE